MDKTYRSTHLVVGVTYYNNRANAVKKCCDEYEELLTNYIEYLNNMNTEGIVSGNTADVLESFIEEVKSAKQIISSIGEDYSKQIVNFLDDIDEADDKLFKNKGRKILTDEEFNNARAVSKVEFSLSSIFDGTWAKYLLDKIWTKKLANELVDQTSKMAQKVKTLNEYTDSDLSKIQGAVKLVDKKYSKRLSNILKELRDYNSIILKIAEIMLPTGNNFTEKNLTNLRSLIKKSKKFREQVLKNPEYEKITDDDVKYFADNVDDYFNKSTDAIESICQDSLANFFLTDFEKYRATVNAAKEYFNSYSEDYKFSKDKFDSRKKEFDEMLSLYNKYGSKWTENFADKDKAERFNKIISKFTDISENSEAYIDIWYQMFFDMSESEEVLGRFESNCDLSNENVKKAIQRLEELYDNKIDAYLDETVEELRRNAEKDGIKSASKALASTLKNSSKIAGYLAENIINQAYKEMPAVAEYEWVESTNKTLNNALEKLKNTSTDSKYFDERVKAVREAFDASKEAQMGFFEKMISAAQTDTEKDYYKYCYDTIDNSSLNDLSALDIMYETEYNSINYNPLTDLNI